MFTFFCVSASVGAVIATVQVVAALRGVPDALPLNDVAMVTNPAPESKRGAALTCLSVPYVTAHYNCFLLYGRSLGP